jgi:hypothetical protein
MECDRLAAEHICKACGSFRCHLEAVVAKKGTYTEKKMGCQRYNIHQSALFKATTSFNMI